MPLNRNECNGQSRLNLVPPRALSLPEAPAIPAEGEEILETGLPGSRKGWQ